MSPEDERFIKIKNLVCDYIKKNEISAYCTPAFFARGILPTESFFLKQQIIYKLMESGLIVEVDKKLIIKE
ncbi:MAG: hypothetical protein ACPK85_10460 [Methanosarcina sp.]